MTVDKVGRDTSTQKSWLCQSRLGWVSHAFGVCGEGYDRLNVLAVAKPYVKALKVEMSWQMSMLNPFTVAISVMLNMGPHVFFFSCNTRCCNLYTRVYDECYSSCIADSTFHDEPYSSPAAKGLILIKQQPFYITPTKNWWILLGQSFTAYMALLIATSTVSNNWSK